MSDAAVGVDVDDEELEAGEDVEEESPAEAVVDDGETALVDESVVSVDAVDSDELVVVPGV